MAGRGRGRGRGGLPMMSMMEPGMKAEPIVPLLVPPPHYPPLEYRPLPTTITTELRYMLQLKKSYADFMLESPNNVLPKTMKKEIKRYSDKYRESSKQRYDDRYDWSRMPVQLKSVVKKKSNKLSEDGLKIKKPKVMDVNAKLQELESKEAVHQSDDEEDEKKDADDEDKDDDAAEDEEDSDEEMDEGTDYVNNYFDNGEDYEEDDDKDNAEPEYS